jgi:hypothetical protein
MSSFHPGPAPPQMQSEIYSIDVNPRRNVVVYGGANDKCTAMDLETGALIAVVEGYNDSVIFTQFIDDERFIVASLDGAISLMTAEQEIETAAVDGDISRIKVSGDALLVGTSKGIAYVFALDLSMQHVYMGQPSEIVDLEYDCGRVYTLSPTNYIVFDAAKYHIMLDQRVRNGCAFAKIPGSDVVCYGSENRVTIRKNYELMDRIDLEGSPECILCMGGYFVVGGSFRYLMLINISMGMRLFKVPLEVDGITNIVGDGKNGLVFSTLCGQCGHGDIRDDKSFRLFEVGVGAIFALRLVDGAVYAAGQCGLSAVRLDDPEHLIPILSFEMEDGAEAA